MNLVPGRTHIRSRSLRLTASSRCNNVGKGSRQIGSVTSGQGLALSAGPAGLGRARAGRSPPLAQVDCVPLRARRRWAPRSGSGCGSACSRAPAFRLGSRVVGGPPSPAVRFLIAASGGAVSSRGRPSVLLPGSVCRGLRPPSAVRWGRAAVRVRRVGIELGSSLQPSRGLPHLCGVASARAAVSAGIQHPTQNWYGPGESDCLIKTKHRDGRHPVLTQCDFCPVL